MFAFTKTLGLLGMSASLLWAVKHQELQMIHALVEQLDAQVPELELLSSGR